jgi:hypothetical protein
MASPVYSDQAIIVVALHRGHCALEMLIVLLIGFDID